jgi:hypothetical protein
MPDESEYESLDIPEQARWCWKQAMDAEHEFRQEFRNRLKFRAGNAYTSDETGGGQWKPEDIQMRGKDRPAVTVNLLEQPIQQVINANLRNRPGGKVTPADDDATPQVAEYLQGRIRHIEYASDAQVAYGTCIGYVASGGLGYVGLTIDYVSPDSLEQEVRIRSIDDPACWAIDPSAKEPDKRDARWAIGRQRFSKEEFQRRWPDAQVVDASWWGIDSKYKDWGDEENVWVGEYWKLKFKKRKLQRFANGQTGFTDDKDFLRLLPAGIQALPGNGNSREVDYPVVTQYLVSGAEVLDETPWPGKRIPLYEVTANEFYADGKRIRKSLISDALDSQRTYNCSESLKLEAVVMAPKPKWVANVAQLEGHEQEWKTANTSQDSVLFYNGTQDSRGNPVPPPDWKVFTPPVQEFTLVSNQAKEDVKATTGFFDPSLGALSQGDRSGKAILALQQQTGIGIIHYAEALARALKALYQDLIEIDVQLTRQDVRKRRIVHPDGRHELVKVNDDSPGVAKPIMLGKGRYEPIVSVGPSYQTQRDAASDFMDTIAEHDPQGWTMIRDLAARTKEPELGHYADDIATRWQAALPPGMVSQDPTIAPQVAQAQGQIQILQQQVQQLHQVIQQKQVEEQGKYNREMAVEQQKFQTEELKAATQIRVAELNARNDQLLTMMDARVKQLEAAADRWQGLLLQAQSHAHAQSQQAHKHAHEAAILAQEHAHAMHKAEAQYETQAEQPIPSGADLVEGPILSAAAPEAGAGAGGEAATS